MIGIKKINKNIKLIETTISETKKIEAYLGITLTKNETNKTSFCHYKYYGDSKIDNNKIDMDKTLVLPIKVFSDYMSSPKNTILNDNKLEQIINYHFQIMEYDKKRYNTLSNKEKKIIDNASNHWTDIYSKYGKIKHIYASIYKIDNIYICNYNGKFRDDKRFGDFFDFNKYYLKKNNNDIWNDIKIPSPEFNVAHCDNYIIEKADGYYCIEKKESKRLTNWTCSFLEEFFEEIESIDIHDNPVTNRFARWRISINDEEIILLPTDVANCCKFQRTILNKGLFFYYGNSYQLKFLIEHIRNFN